MINQKEILQELKNKITDFVYPLKLENVFIENKYDELVVFLIDLTKKFKEEEYILKEIVIELRLTISSMENFQGVHESIEDDVLMIEKLLWNLLCSEVYGNRIPGVPRVI